MVCEAHTINDWLLGKSPKEYEKSLTKLLQKMKRTARAWCLSRFRPFWANPGLAPFNQTPYHEFVATARRAAKSEGVFFADANRKMADFLAGRTEREQQELFFADNWHVNDLGHRMYAECILEVLEKENLL